MSLPLPVQDQAYCDVSVLEAGHLHMLLGQLVDIAKVDEMTDIPVLAFVLRHSRSGDTFIFDLGIRPDPENYSEGARTLTEKMGMKLQGRDLAAALERGGLLPSQVKHVCISHIHFDHTGVPASFPNATFLLGAGAGPIISKLAPAFHDTMYAIEVPLERTTFLDASATEWAPLGPFPRALDFYGDGSLYIVDAPGHIPGHVNVIARTSADGGWVYLAADSAHDWRILTGEVGIGFHAVFGCIHEDPRKAQENIDRIKVVKEIPRVRVLLAHDTPWYNANKGGNAFWPGKIESL